MAKRIATLVVDNLPTELLFFKSEFIKVLNERIALGEALYNKSIHTPVDFKKCKDDYFSWNNYNSEYLRKAFNKDKNEFKKSYDDCISAFFSSFTLRDSASQDVKNFKDKISNKISTLKKIREKTDFMKTRLVKNNLFKKDTLEPTNLQIFIVPGEDVITQKKTIQFVENLGFEAIILEEHGFSNQTLLEKTEAYPDAKFGIVLYTPSSKEEKLLENGNIKLKAQYNKIFEHGFLMGKIGKSNVCALVKDSIEMPNDISGAVYITMDETDLWCYSLAKELKKAGYSINMKKYNCA